MRKFYVALAFLMGCAGFVSCQKEEKIAGSIEIEVVDIWSSTAKVKLTATISRNAAAYSFGYRIEGEDPAGNSLAGKKVWEDSVKGEPGTVEYTFDLYSLKPGVEYEIWGFVESSHGRSYGDHTIFLSRDLGDVIYCNDFEAVNLGLSVKWSSCNIKAAYPEKYGEFYQWAGITKYDGGDYCPYKIASGWTKYVTSDHSSGWDGSWAGSGSPDNKIILDPADDVANVVLGGNWRIPTMDEWSELKDGCEWIWVDDYNGTGVAGRLVVSWIPGYEGKSIFLPAAGSYKDGNYVENGQYGYYWSSSVFSLTPSDAWGVYFLEPQEIVSYTYVYVFPQDRSCGFSVRPVCD